MSDLARERVGPWVRALRAAVVAAAPYDDFVPMAHATAHLDALDPAVSGDLLLPASVHPDSGMPALPWMTRATAEQAVTRSAERAPEMPTEAVRELDPALYERMASRAALHRHLMAHTLLDVLAVRTELRRETPRLEVFVVFDHIDPEGCWVRTRVELAARSGQMDLGLVRVLPMVGPRVAPGAHDLFARHVRTPLSSLYAALSEVTGGGVLRLSRARVGPFWFPGGPAHDTAPDVVRRTLVLNLLHEVAGEGVARSGDFDPLDTSPMHTPRGVNAQRHRRFAVFRTGVPVVREWLGADALIHPFD